jgi:hypothetical protein
MRHWRGFYGAVLAVVLVGAAASCVPAATDSDLGYAIRVSGEGIGVPPDSGTVKLEAALDLRPLSIAAWAEGHIASSWTLTAGGEARLQRDWLTVRGSVAGADVNREVSVVALASPAGWLMYEGALILIGNLGASAGMTWLGNRRAPESSLTVSPVLTAVIPVGAVNVSPSIHADLTLDPDTARFAVSGVQLSSLVNAGTVLLSNTVYFSGPFETFHSLVVSVSLPEIGIAVRGSMQDVGNRNFLVRIGLSYERGNASLLPMLPGRPATVCTGDVCY